MEYEHISDLLSCIAIEAQEHPDWQYDTNTTVMLITIKNIQSLLQAAMEISNNFTEMDKIHWGNFTASVANCAHWMIENMEAKEKTDG